MHRNKFGQEYDVLIGGAVEIGETVEQAVLREIAEEAGIQVDQPRLVYVERASDPYGVQYIFLCDYVQGEPHLAADSPEYAIGQMGKNLYSLAWRTAAEIAAGQFKSEAVQAALLEGLEKGFPASPVEITDKQVSRQI